jgi:hypothetical protein
MVPLSSKWDDLASMCVKLAELADKQLHDQDFDRDDEGFIYGYGKKLSSIMLYEGHAYLNPEDDAPKIVTGGYNHVLTKYFLVGMGRPREFFVMYPKDGKEIICRGAVLPYYEFPHSTPLTDVQWKDMLDSKKKPMVPDYMQPLIKE